MEEACMRSTKARKIISILIIFLMIITTGYNNAAFAAETDTTTGIATATDAQENESEKLEEVTEESVNDESISDEDTATDTDALEENGIFNYAVIEADYVTAPSSQYILVDISDTTDVIESAALNYTNLNNGNTYKAGATILQDTAIVFDPYFSAGQAGEYKVDSVEYYVEGNKYEIVFDEIGADLRFGVNEEVDVDPLLWIVDEDYSEADAVSVEDVTNKDFQKLDEGDFIKIELDSEEDIQNLENGNYDAITGDDSASIESDSLVAQAETVKELDSETGLSMSTNEFSTLGATNANRKGFIIVLDPGHGQSGGRDTGACANGLVERDINLKIALACRDALSKYDNVILYMTRTTSVSPYTLGGLSDYAKSVGASYLISFHNNAAGSSSVRGSLVCVANSNYNSYVYHETNNLGNAILKQLAALGLPNKGNLVRNSENGTRYPDGTAADYYSIVYNGKINNIPQIIIEHAFMTNTTDANNYLRTDAQLQALGQADARGIANALGLGSGSGPITVYNGLDYSPVYNKDYYLAANPDVKKAFGGNEMKTFEHFLTFGMKEGRRASASFDVNYYKNRYGDLRNAYGSNLKSYYLHYLNYGKKEGRVATDGKNTITVPTSSSSTPAASSTTTTKANYATTLNGINYSAVYDYNYYINKYGDLKKAFGTNDKATLQHFVTYGMNEGRQASANFNVTTYKNRYGDLRNAYGNNLKAYYLHYINYGKKEGRNATGTAAAPAASSSSSSNKASSSTSSSTSYATTLNGVNYSAVYDFNYYINKYGDLRNAFGTNDKAALQHFVTYGMKEGRQASPAFNVTSYKNRYGDLRNAFGNDTKAYYLHYINYGKREGRDATGNASAPASTASKSSTSTSSSSSSSTSKTTVYNGVNYSDVYNFDYYINKYGDLKKAFGNNDQAAIQHFVTYGMKEGRQACANFEVNSYKNRYGDLRNAYGNNLPMYYMHYIKYGKKENRIATPGSTPAASTSVNTTTPTTSSNLTPIMGTSKTNVAQMVRYFNANAPYPAFYKNSDAPTIQAFCQIYYEEAAAEGVRAEVAFAQAMKETGFLRFGGSVSITQYNFAGLGATGNGVSGNGFGSVRNGVRAQIQHLKAYGSTAPLNKTCVDVRFQYVKRGTCPCVENLGINEDPVGIGWATAKNYGYSVVNDYMNKLLTK